MANRIRECWFSIVFNMLRRESDAIPCMWLSPIHYTGMYRDGYVARYQ